MGCQLEPQGAALQELQRAYASKGVLLCGLDRLEHPYDVEDYLRHFGFTFPVFVDLNDESPPVAHALLGSIALLDRTRQRVRRGGKNEFDPEAIRPVLEKVLASSRASAQASPTPAGLLRPPAQRRNPAPPHLAAPGWSEPRRLGAGQYPRIVSLGGGTAFCAWVTADMPQQQLEHAVCSNGRWDTARKVPTGQDAHAVAVDVDAQGHPVIVWAQKDAAAYRIYLNTCLGPEWRSPIAISPVANNAFRPNVFCRPSGKVIVAWYGWKRVKLRDYPNAWWRSIYVCEVVENRPGAPCELAELRRGSDDCWDPVVTGTAADLQVSWLRDENPPKLWTSASGPAGWSRPESLLQLADGTARAFRVQASSPVQGASGRHSLLFEMVSPGRIGPYLAGTHVYLARFATNHWAQPLALSARPGRHIAPVGVELPDGRCLVFWSHLPGPGKPATIRMRETKAGASPDLPDSLIIDGDSASLYPSASADGEGNVWLAWQTEEPSCAQAIYVSMRPPMSLTASEK